MMDLIAGNVLFGSMTWSSALAHIRAGSVVPVAISARTRLADFPDVPTLAELGYPELVAYTWYGLSGPAGLPAEITSRLNEAVNALMALPEVRRRLDDESIVTEPMSSEAFTAFMAGEVAKWGPIARRIATAPPR
jgi:tripartite-type tricarboxylate transporter receptor subunit TctC